MRLIDADALIESIEQCRSKHSIFAQFVRAYAKDTPTAVPIVRCKECMYSETDDMGFYYCVHGIIGGYGVTFDANMFCSYGERKDHE